jgi:hypothetical protein
MNLVGNFYTGAEFYKCESMKKELCKELDIMLLQWFNWKLSGVTPSTPEVWDF